MTNQTNLLGQTIRIQEAITLAGGLTDSATGFAYLIRRDSTNTSLQEYIRIDLAEAINNPNSVANIQLEPYDELTVPSDELFTDVSTLEVAGAELTLPRRWEIGTPTEDNINFVNVKAAYDAQGYTTGTNDPVTLNTERIWFDTNNPNYGEGPNN